MMLMQITMHDAIPPYSRTDPFSCTIAGKPEKVQEILRSAMDHFFATNSAKQQNQSEER